MSEKRESVANYYDAAAEWFHEQYDREKLYDVDAPYPAHYFGLELLLNSFVTKGIKRVIDVGMGEGTPLVTLSKAGMDAWGFDISRKMVEKSQEKIKACGIDPEHVFWGDIQDPKTYAHALRDGQFDGLVAMCVMPHIKDDDAVLRNISSLVREGGTVFIAFRNKLFSLFTFNRYTLDFILNDLLAGISREARDIVDKDLRSRLRLDMPVIQRELERAEPLSSDTYLGRFHNPFEVIELFERHNFRDIKLHWYHYHPAMPYLEEQMPALFRKEAIRLEQQPADWRGSFLCSAFVVESIQGYK